MRKCPLLLLMPVLMLITITSCEKEDQLGSITLLEISKESFTYSGGLGTAVFNTGNEEISVESDQDWCKVAIFGSTVNFNVFSFYGTTDRTAVITVRAGNLTPYKINIFQTRFQGLVVSHKMLTFTSNITENVIAVTASDSYDIQLSENPQNTFSYEKTETGLIFRANNPPGTEDIKGRAVLTPEEGEQVIITLTQEKKSTYDHILGTWQVSKNNLDYNASWTFTINEDQNSYNVTLDHELFGTSFPFKAEFVDGKVVVQGGQKLGTRDVDGKKKYVSLHFNGSINGAGTYIFTAEGTVGWEATPVFNQTLGTVTLSFEDNGQGGSRVANHLAFWYCSNDYFNGWETRAAAYEGLELRKSF